MTQIAPEAAREAVARLIQWLSDHREQEREDYEDGEIAKLDGQGEFVLSDVEALLSERDALKAQVAELQEQNQNIWDAHESLQKGYAMTVNSNYKLETQLAELTAQNERQREALVTTERHLTNMQPHIAQKPVEIGAFIDVYVDMALEAIQAALNPAKEG